MTVTMKSVRLTKSRPRKNYSGILIFRTSRGNVTNWFEKSGVREIEGGIKLRLIGRVSLDYEYAFKFQQKHILFNVDLYLYLQTKRI